MPKKPIPKPPLVTDSFFYPLFGTFKGYNLQLKSWDHKNYVPVKTFRRNALDATLLPYPYKSLECESEQNSKCENIELNEITKSYLPGDIIFVRENIPLLLFANRILGIARKTVFGEDSNFNNQNLL